MEELVAILDGGPKDRRAPWFARKARRSETKGLNSCSSRCESRCGDDVGRFIFERIFGGQAFALAEKGKLSGRPPCIG